MRARLQRLADRWWYERERPPAWLRPLAALYGALTFRRGGRPSARPPVPVIVVGNLTAGGSGKTPVVEALVRDLVDGGLRVGVISRGYGGAEPARPLRVLVDSDPRTTGDEALAVHRSTGAPTWVCRDRAAALAAAVADDCRVVISDDGLQHHGLPRSFEVCVIDGRRGFGNGALLPAGPLRQSPARLEQIDAAVIKAPVHAAVRAMLPEGLPTLELVPAGWTDVNGNTIDAPATGPVDAVAGIADPTAFFASLEQRGFSVRRHPLPDHGRIDPDWLGGLPGPVVTTTKDAARLAGLTGERRRDLFVQRIEARLPVELLEAVRAHVREFSP